MDSSVILCINLFYLGSLIWFALFCLIACIRQKNRALLGIALYCLGAASLFYFRRIFPFPMAENTIDNSFIITGIYASIHLIVGSVLMAIFSFFKFPENRKLFPVLVFFYILLSVLLLVVLSVMFISGNADTAGYYFGMLVFYTAAAVIYLLYQFKRKIFSISWNKRLLRFIILLLLYYTALAVISICSRETPYYFVIIFQYFFLFYSFKIFSEKINNDYSELLTLKSNPSTGERSITCSSENGYNPVQKTGDIPDDKFKEYQFTRRENDIISLVVKGFPNREIGDKLCISPRTVDNHIYNIYKKVNCQNRIELINLLYVR